VFSLYGSPERDIPENTIGKKLLARQTQDVIAVNSAETIFSNYSVLDGIILNILNIAIFILPLRCKN
jgi:hypothetical protein